MFFIVHFDSIKTNVIIPPNWIKGINDQMEKFINYGINCNQLHRCFFTLDESAYDENGCPKLNYKPNFDMPLRNDLNGDGCFYGKIRKYKGKEFIFRFVSID